MTVTAWSALPEVAFGSIVPPTTIVAVALLSRLTGIALPLPVCKPALSCTVQVPFRTLAGSRSPSVMSASPFGPALFNV